MHKIIVVIIAVAALICIGYALFVLYDIVMTDVTLRLKDAIAEGIREGITSTVNPLNWPRALLQQ